MTKRQDDISAGADTLNIQAKGRTECHCGRRSFEKTKKGSSPLCAFHLVVAAQGKRQAEKQALVAIAEYRKDCAYWGRLTRAAELSWQRNMIMGFPMHQRAV